MPQVQRQLRFSRYQILIIAFLSFIQFTVILDFMVIAPLGAMLWEILRMSPAQFGWAVSAYAFSAGVSGLLAAGFADRYDRKHFLLFFYTGFVIGSILCGVATDYRFLLLARVVTGLFGGVLASVSLAIVTDLFPIILFAGILSRMVPATALMTAVPEVVDRGAFMSVNASLQQIAGGVASILAGAIVVQNTSSGPLEHYDILGYLCVCLMFLCIGLLYGIHKHVEKKLSDRAGVEGDPQWKEPVLLEN